jgi:hypothetical protein
MVLCLCGWDGASNTTCTCCIVINLPQLRALSLHVVSVYSAVSYSDFLPDDFLLGYTDTSTSASILMSCKSVTDVSAKDPAIYRAWDAFPAKCAL